MIIVHCTCSDSTSVSLDSSTNSILNGPTSFTVDETQQFLRRYNEGYDLHHDEHYNLWLKTFQPGEGPHLSPVATPPSVHDSGNTSGPASGSGVAKCKSGQRTSRGIWRGAMCVCLSPSLRVMHACYTLRVSLFSQPMATEALLTEGPWEVPRVGQEVRQASLEQEDLLVPLLPCHLPVWEMFLCLCMYSCLWVLALVCPRVCFVSLKLCVQLQVPVVAEALLTEGSWVVPRVGQRVPQTKPGTRTKLPTMEVNPVVNRG